MLGHVSFGRNVWEFVDCFSLVVRTLRKITRQLMCLVVFVWRASYVGLAGVCALVGFVCELLTRSKLVIKSLIGGAMNPLGLRHTILQSH